MAKEGKDRNLCSASGKKDGGGARRVKASLHFVKLRKELLQGHPRPGDEASLFADTRLLFPGKDAVSTIQVEPPLLGGFFAMTW